MFPKILIDALFSLNIVYYLMAIAAILLDLITGFVIKGLIPHRVSSSAMREGLVHKAWEIAIILAATLIDVAISVGMGIGLQPMSAVTCVYIFVMEIASVCENAVEGNPQFASAPVVKYVAMAKRDAEGIDQDATVKTIDPDATTELPRHLGGE